MLKKTSTNTLEGNENYEGFIIDLAKEIATIGMYEISVKYQSQSAMINLKNPIKFRHSKI